MAMRARILPERKPASADFHRQYFRGPSISQQVSSASGIRGVGERIESASCCITQATRNFAHAVKRQPRQNASVRQLKVRAVRLHRRGAAREGFLNLKSAFHRPFIERPSPLVGEAPASTAK